MKRFASLFLTAVLSTAATVAFSESAQALPFVKYHGARFENHHGRRDHRDYHPRHHREDYGKFGFGGVVIKGPYKGEDVKYIRGHRDDRHRDFDRDHHRDHDYRHR